MKTFLMHPDRDFDAQPPKQPLQFAQDLELNVLLDAAAAGDRYLRDTVHAACAQAWTNDIATVRYRQDVLKDCLANPRIVRQFYAITIEPFGREHGWNFSLFSRDASSKVGSGVRTLQNCLDILGRLRDASAANAKKFTSLGFRQFFETLETDLDDIYLEAACIDLDNLTFRSGLLLSAQVGDGGKALGTMLRKPQPRDLSWIRRIFTPEAPSYRLQLHPRDEAGARAFGELQGRGLGLIAEAIYQSAEHVLSFIKSLRAELGFYLACLNLKERLDQIGEPVTFPEAMEGNTSFSCRNLRDICLALTMGRSVVGNHVNANKKTPIIVTGANRGGKSTFLRSVGLAQLMLQCGMFVSAEMFDCSLRTGLFSHYKRQEDRNMDSGKFDEELVRMSAIADHIRPGALVLFNESFAATHEREGSEIARQITSALLENGVTVFFVSHMYELSRSFLNDGRHCSFGPIAQRAVQEVSGYAKRGHFRTASEPIFTSGSSSLPKKDFDPLVRRSTDVTRSPTRFCGGGAGDAPTPSVFDDFEGNPNLDIFPADDSVGQDKLHFA